MNIKALIAIKGVSISVLLGLAACSTTDESDSLISQCTFSDGSKAPAWICNFDDVYTPTGLDKVTWVVGQAKKIPAGRAFQKRIAITQARGELLNLIATRVENLIQQQVQGSSAQDASEQFIQSFSEGILKGARPYSRVIDRESGEVYVLVGIRDDDFKDNIAGNKQYQELREAILAAGGKETARRIDSGLDRISEAKKNMGLEGARKIANERNAQ